MFDVLILVAEKDFNKLRFVQESIEQHVKGVATIKIISNVRIPKDKTISGTSYFLDNEVLDFDYSVFSGVIKARQGWYKQQFIKLFQEVTTDDYLVVDSDAIFNKDLSIMVDGKPSFLFGKDQYNEPYFDLMLNVCNIKKYYPHSFINEVMFFKRDIIHHLLYSMNVTKYGFFALVSNELNKQNQVSGFSEYELYGNYVTGYFPNLYHYRYMKTHADGKHRLWTDEEIRKQISLYKNKEYDMISLHSWLSN